MFCYVTPDNCVNSQTNEIVWVRLTKWTQNQLIVSKSRNIVAKKTENSSRYTYRRGAGGGLDARPRLGILLIASSYTF